MPHTVDCLVIGGGPGGFAAAVRAAEHGLKTVLVNRGELGGTCLNRGCIPTKFLLGVTQPAVALSHQVRLGLASGTIQFDLPAIQKRIASVLQAGRNSMRRRLDALGIEVVAATAEFTGPDTCVFHSGKEAPAAIRFRRCILATGSRPAALPHIPFDHERICDSTDLLNLDTVPGSLGIIGGGAIGVELGQALHRLGARIVLIEALPSLFSGEDPEVGKTLRGGLKKAGWEVHLSDRVERVVSGASSLELHLASGKIREVETLLVAIGRKAELVGVKIETAGLSLNERGFTATDDFLRASPTVFAVGDVNGYSLYAHAAEHQAVYAADVAAADISGRNAPAPYSFPTIPSCAYGDPAVFRVGLTESQARERHDDVRTTRVELAANPIPQAHGAPSGMIKVVWSGNRPVGMTGVGSHVEGLVTLAESLCGRALTPEMLRGIIFAHPTLDESLRHALELGLSA